MSNKILALALFAGGLVACGGGDAAPADDSATPADVAPAEAPMAAAGLDGATEYANTCAVCHQADGAGMASAFPPLAGSGVVNADSPDRMIAIVLKGMSGPVTVAGAEFNGLMTPFEGILSDEQIAAITTYERSSFGNTASAVTAEQVAAVRARFADVSESWTVETLDAALN
jgi:mono/diheme cytochrome c family protein